MAPAAQPKGFTLEPSGVHAANKTTGQAAKWDEDRGAWVDSKTGEAIPRTESISAEPPSDGPAGDDCRKLRWRYYFLEGMANAYRAEAAHADSAASSETANVADNAKAFSKHSGHELDPAQVGMGLGFDAAMTGGIALGLVEAGLWPFAVPLAAAMVGSSLGAAVRDAINAKDEAAAAKKSLNMLEAARARLGFWQEHSAALQAASGDASRRAGELRKALDNCPDDPCRVEVMIAARSAGRLEALRRTKAAVDAQRSAASEAADKAGQAAAGASGDTAAVMNDAAGIARTVATAGERESYRLERLINEASERADKDVKDLADCPKPGAVVVPIPPVTGAGGPGGPKAPVGLGSLGWLFILLLVVLSGLGLGFLLLGNNPAPVGSATPSAPASATPSTDPGTASPPPSVLATPGRITTYCVRVTHEALDTFVSYLDWSLLWSGVTVERFELTVIGANDDEPASLVYDPQSGSWDGQLGLHEAGSKTIVSLVGHAADGSTIDLTQEMIDAFGSDEFVVRFPEEDTFGDCD
ncbi:MAG: hypothetical protein QOJ81_154 [Chloroflexota bacterium]|jgi:hypothetical protein|nr:hypothetical protein [Chloroflexota bacterium]